MKFSRIVDEQCGARSVPSLSMPPDRCGVGDSVDTDLVHLLSSSSEVVAAALLAVALLKTVEHRYPYRTSIASAYDPSRCRQDSIVSTHPC
jgi:hypothetical protein